MTNSNISALFEVKARLLGDLPAQGGLDTIISQTVRGESLDSFYSQVISGSNLTTTDQVFDTFPNVQLNESAINGQDGQPLELNSINGIIVQVIQNAGQTSAGFATVTLNLIGTNLAQSFQLVAGDCFQYISERGWPGNASSVLTVGATGLTNCNVVICLLGKKDVVGTGYLD